MCFTCCVVSVGIVCGAELGCKDDSEAQLRLGMLTKVHKLLRLNSPSGAASLSPDGGNDGRKKEEEEEEEAET